MKINCKDPDDEEFDFPEAPRSDPSPETNQELPDVS